MSIIGTEVIRLKPVLFKAIVALCILALLPTWVSASETEPNNDPSQADTLSSDVTGSASSSDKDWYSIIVASGEVLVIQWTLTSGFSDIWVFELADGDGKTIGTSRVGPVSRATISVEVQGGNSVSTSTGTAGTRVEFGVPEVGTYYFALRPESATSLGYRLEASSQLVSDHGDSLSTASVISINERVTADLDSLFDKDYFQLNVPSAGDLVITTSASGFTAVELELLDSDGNRIAIDGDSFFYSGDNSISVPISAEGLFFIKVERTVGGSGGDYVLETQFTPQLDFNASVYLQTNSLSQNISSTHVVNVSSAAQTFTGTLYSGAGKRLGQANIALHDSPIGSKARLILTSVDIERIFDVSPWSGPAVLNIEGSNGFEVMTKLVSPSGLVSNTNCVREDRVLNIEGFDSSNMTYVRLINTENQNTGAVIGTLYDTEGDVIGSADSVLAVNLGAHEQVWVNRNDLADAVGAQWNGEALLEVNQIAGLKLLNLNYITDEKTFFNFSCFEDNTSGTVYLQTTSTSQNVSFTHLVNTSDTAQQLTGTLYSKDGSQLGEANQPLHGSTIAPKGRVVISSLDIEAAFAVSPWSGPAMLEVQGSDSFALMTKLTSPSGLISNTNCVREDQVHNIGGYDQTDVTYIRFINTGDTTLTNIRGSLYNAAGDVIGTADPILVESLAPKSQVWRPRDELSSLVGDTWNGTASLVIANASEDLRLLNLNYINNETFFNFSCYETGQLR